jgi:hypothetical protein
MQIEIINLNMFREWKNTFLSRTDAETFLSRILLNVEVKCRYPCLEASKCRLQKQYRRHSLECTSVACCTAI